MTTTTPLAGEWFQFAFVHGKVIHLLDKEVLTGRTYTLQGKEVTIDLKSGLPLSIFTTGYDLSSQGGIGLGYCPAYPRTTEAIKIFTFPPSLWKQKISEHQRYSSDLMTRCDDSIVTLGHINVFNLPPDYLRTDSSTSTGNTHAIRSSTGDFTLRYTISVEPINR